LEGTVVITGVVLIFTGILLMVYPPLLSIIVAAFLILSGVMVLSVARYNRRLERQFNHPAIDIFFRQGAYRNSR
jgi:divalent metal cation (Fe/Co/Zn/Cd) transporter